jgi:rod shape-determining protein MreC
MRHFRDVAGSTASNKLLIGRGLMVALVVTGVMLLVLSRAGSPALTQARMQFLAFSAPIIQALSQPIESVKNGVGYVQELVSAREENIRLKAENDTLKRWQSVALSLKAENDALRSLSGYQPIEQVRYISAKRVGDLSGSFSHSMLVNAGKEEGVKRYQPVIDNAGLLGRVTELGAHHAQVMAVTDANSRIPVLADNARTRAILMGQGKSLMKLGFLTENHTITVGDRILTSDDGALMPAGIAVGEVFKVDGREVWVKPMRDLRDADYIRVIDYQAGARE